MKINHSNKNSVGRPSLPSITAIVGDKHKSINFSTALAKIHNLSAGAKVDLISVDGKLYISFETGIYNIRAKKNGCKDRQIITLTCSSTFIVDTLMKQSGETKKCIYLVSAKSIDYKGSKYYMLIDKPLQIW